MPKIHLTISKTFSDGDPFPFASVRWCPGRGGYIFNTTLPGRRPSRKPWPTPWAAIPRWVKGQDKIHLTMKIK